MGAKSKFASELIDFINRCWRGWRRGSFGSREGSRSQEGFETSMEVGNPGYSDSKYENY
jgi:hypothetical protein